MHNKTNYHEIEKKTDPLLGESVYRVKHKSGLEIQYMPKKGYSKKFAYFATKYGAIYNTFEIDSHGILEMPLGIAHFLEHKIFEDTDGDIFDKFSKLGASVNAYTNSNSTAYMFSTVDHFNECLELLIDFVQNCHLTDENVEKEKGIIAQEIKMYDDDPDWRVYFNALKALYHNHPIREDVAGSVESVYATTRDQLQLCFDAFYAPQNMILFIIGDLNLDEILESIDKSLSETYLNKSVTPKLILPHEPDSVHEAKVHLKMNVPVPLFELGIKDTQLISDPLENMRISTAMKLALDMHFGKGSEFYRKCYEDGLINATFYYEYSFGMSYAHVMFGGESNVPDKVVEAIKKEVQKIQTLGLNQDAFTRIKRKAIGRYLSAFNSVQYVAGAFVSYFMKQLDLFDYLNTLESLEIEFVESVMKEHLKMDHVVLSIVE